MRPVLDMSGGAAEARPLPRLRGIDVNRAPAGATERDSEEDAGTSSPNSTLSSVSGKRGERDHHLGDELDPDRACSRGISDEEDGDGSRKKLRLSKDQSAILEDSFKEHNTLNPMLRDPHRREPEAAEGSAGAESSEAVAAVLHAHDSPNHTQHVPFLRARLQLHHHLLTVDQRADARTPSDPPPPADPGPVGADPAPALPRCPSAALLAEFTSTTPTIERTRHEHHINTPPWPWLLASRQRWVPMVGGRRQDVLIMTMLGPPTIRRGAEDGDRLPRND
ncbi:hypothetical protein BHE74_00036005 [Ensete ventricosum]|nr:hypothetical protein BHE74_00036005 [Ensete ventricosum]